MTLQRPELQGDDPSRPDHRRERPQLELESEAEVDRRHHPYLVDEQVDARVGRGADPAAACLTRVLAEPPAPAERPRLHADLGYAWEWRTARLAAEEATNREIAQRLFVSRRTVEIHLTSTYRKPGIDSRCRLKAALAALPTA